MWDVFLSKAWSAVSDELPEASLFNQPKCLERSLVKIYSKHAGRKTYLILAYNQLDNVVEKSFGSKQWLFGLATDN
jgi:hypothetical protein